MVAVNATPIEAANAPHAKPNQEKNFLREIASAMLLSFAVRFYEVQKNQKITKQDYQLGIFLSQELAGNFCVFFKMLVEIKVPAFLGQNFYNIYYAIISD